MYRRIAAKKPIVVVLESVDNGRLCQKAFALARPCTYREIKNMKGYTMHKLLRISLISIATGIALTILELVSTIVAFKTGINFIVDYYRVLDTIFALTLFVVTGKIFVKDMSRKEVVKSATVFSIYYILILILQIALINKGVYTSSLTALFIPTHMYALIGNWLLEISYRLAYWALVPSIAAPFLYVIFAKESGKHE